MATNSRHKRAPEACLHTFIVRWSLYFSSLFFRCIYDLFSESTTTALLAGCSEAGRTPSTKESTSSLGTAYRKGWRSLATEQQGYRCNATVQWLTLVDLECRPYIHTTLRRDKSRFTNPRLEPPSGFRQILPSLFFRQSSGLWRSLTR